MSNDSTLPKQGKHTPRIWLCHSCGAATTTEDIFHKWSCHGDEHDTQGFVDETIHEELLEAAKEANKLLYELTPNEMENKTWKRLAEAIAKAELTAGEEKE